MARHKEYNKDEVLKNAMELFWEKGFEGTHLQDLVVTCGVNRFSLYSEFGGKDGLFHECVQHYLNQARVVYQAHLTTTPLGLRNIEEYFQSLSSSENNGCFFVNTLSEEPLVKRETFNLAKSFSSEIESLFRDCLIAEFPDASVQSMSDFAKLFVALDHGLAIFDASRKSRKDFSASKKALGVIFGLLRAAKLR